MTAYGQIIGAAMPAGFAGDIARGEFDFTTETRINNATTPVLAFGLPVKLNADGTVSPASGSDTVFGFSVRTFGQADYAGVQKDALQTVLRRGYFFANVAGTPVINGKVYIAADGSLTAASSGTEIPGAVFVSAAVDGLAEIAYNI